MNNLEMLYYIKENISNISFYTELEKAVIGFGSVISGSILAYFYINIENYRLNKKSEREEKKYLKKKNK